VGKEGREGMGRGGNRRGEGRGRGKRRGASPQIFWPRTAPE